jgi:hypothetical protein
VGVTLKTREGKKWILRIGSNPFYDAETRKLSGRSLEVEGYCLGNELHYVSAKQNRRPRLEAVPRQRNSVERSATGEWAIRRQL